MFLAEQTDRIEHVLVTAGVAERVGELSLEPRLIGKRAEEARIEQWIDDMRVLRENIGETWRDAEDERDETKTLRDSAAAARAGAAGAQPARKRIECGIGRIRLSARAN